MGKRKGQITQMSHSLLVKGISRKQGRRKGTNDSFLHTTDLEDGTTYNRINFQSVTEQNNLEDFLTTAEMAGKDFAAERQNVQIISNPGEGIRLTDADLHKITLAQNANRSSLQIPRRPKWDEETTKEALDLMERDSFTTWRRQLKMLEEKEHIQLTPYEKNLDFWRQLWRVIERSDLVVQIVDARNPLLFRCEDLEICVKEVDPRKAAMLLINKADFLTAQQREKWVDYFNQQGIHVVFFSAKEEKEKQVFPESVSDDTFDSQETDSDVEDVSDIDEEVDEDGDENCAEKDNDNESGADSTDLKESYTCDNSIAGGTDNKDRENKQAADISQDTKLLSPSAHFSNSPDIVSADELLDIFRKLAQPSTSSRSDKVTTVGMVGYPNVGKSSTINVILKEKKLAVSATPGRTKHLQTMFVDEHLMLCDCPGLVFPSFVATKAHLVINGILPIDEMRDHVSPINLICERIPRNVLEATYSIMIPRPSVDDDSNRIPTVEEFLNAYGAMRGFMTARGMPDGPRASRYILKDFVKGKLLYCEPPPEVDGAEFQDKDRISVLEGLRPVSRAPHPQIRSEIDKEFFAQKQSKPHYRGNSGLSEIVGASQLTTRSSEASALGGTDLHGSVSSLTSLSSKPWKKHNNRNKKEKLRRLHRHLDV